MFEKRRILFVEDDSLEIQNISALLKALGLNFVHAATVSEAVRELVPALRDSEGINTRIPAALFHV